MAFIRNCFAVMAMLVSVVMSKAQTVYYPAPASQLLKATASDAASLLQQAIPAAHFTTAAYTALPANGIVFRYDSTITDNQACRVVSDGSSYIRFSAAQDNGLVFGLYQYFQQLGFRFYQPGSIWQKTPVLNSPFQKTDTVYTCTYIYKSWAISGGCNRWVMDNNSSYGWDMYFGENGHNWALYQRRNGMLGAGLFNGHRGDIVTGNYLSSLQSNPCYVACHDSSRTATTQSVPDIHSTAAMEMWANAIENKYSTLRNTISSNPVLYADYYRNFNYRNSRIGIEVPDGARWGNSKDNGLCNSSDYPSASDQQFTLANYTAQKLAVKYPQTHLQLYAYSAHANVPSAGININSNIEVQVVPTAFQNETSAKGLLNRWYNRSRQVSEYHYLNIPQWGGETPVSYLGEMKAALQRAKDKNSQGITWEASPAKFASLPFLFAANNDLKDNTAVDSSLHQFCNDMFGSAAATVFELLQWWGDDRTVMVYDFMQDNRYKIPFYLQLVNRASALARNEAPVVQERIRELKAYVHYMLLYYDWMYDQHSAANKAGKAAALCLYLARVNKMQLVNSYFLISDIVRHYPAGGTFYLQYNITDGTAYQGGNLALISAAEIDNNFQADLATMGNLVNDYQFKEAAFIKDQFSKAGLKPLDTIRLQVTYTNGIDYSNRREFFIYAPAAGNFEIAYTPHFRMAKGYINFTIESAEKALEVITDFSIDQTSGPGTLKIQLPAAGMYKLSLVSKYQSVVDLTISTKGNFFYKNGPFLGCKTENYSKDMRSLPGYFYVPAGISRVYFSINNSGTGGSGYATADQISKAFVIKDNSGSTLLPRLVTPNDSAFFYLDVPSGSSGMFLQAQNMAQYNLCFANISNLQWYAQSGSTCNGIGFTAMLVKKNGACTTQLIAAAGASNLIWEVNEGGKLDRYANTSVVQLPSSLSPDAVVTLISGSCRISRRLGDDAGYVKELQSCSFRAAAPQEEAQVVPAVYPNPSTGVFFCQSNKGAVLAGSLLINDSQGRQVATFSNVSHFNISHLPAGIYYYRMQVSGTGYHGRLIKQ